MRLCIVLALVTIPAAPLHVGHGRPDPSRPVAAPERLVQRAHQAMGTTVTSMAWTNDEVNAQRAFAAAFAELDRIENLMTSWGETSDIARLNAAAGSGRWIALSPDTRRVLAAGLWASQVSGGAFDVTVGAFRGLWKFDEDQDGSIPSPSRVKARLALVGSRGLEIDPRRPAARLRRRGQAVTLGGIAKGYALDLAAGILKRHGLKNFVVQSGGDLLVSGKRGDRPWNVGIRDPRSPNPSSFFATAAVEDRTFSTSGDYERFVVKKGTRYHHILDPRTGYPATASRSVTIMAKDALTADALSTAVFILGPDKGLRLIEKLPDVEAVIVDSTNRVVISSGLRSRIQILHPPTDGL